MAVFHSVIGLRRLMKLLTINSDQNVYCTFNSWTSAPNWLSSGAPSWSIKFLSNSDSPIAKRTVSMGVLWIQSTWCYSKALRCTFLGVRKNSCSSKFVQLLLLNRVKARWSVNHAAQGFHFINSFISNFFGPNSKTCTCKVRAARGRVSRGLTVLNS